MGRVSALSSGQFKQLAVARQLGGNVHTR